MNAEEAVHGGVHQPRRRILFDFEQPLKNMNDSAKPSRPRNAGAISVL